MWVFKILYYIEKDLLAVSVWICHFHKLLVLENPKFDRVRVLKMSANILVVDDSVTFVEVLKNILASEGHQIFTCCDSREVFNILAENMIDVILLDVIMPHIGGFDILHMLQEHEEWRNIPVLIVTGLANPENVKKGLDMGAMDYIKKPCEKIEIIARVHSALRLKEKHDLLLQYATTDGLTQVNNRAQIDRALRTMLGKRAEFEKGVSFIMIDCDFFKRINDTYGHAAGDVVLVGVAAAIRKTVKNIDVVGRFGGEEFCVILPNTYGQDACLAAERIRKNVEKLVFCFNGQEDHITVSLGISYASSNSVLTQQMLINQADEAMYRAKNTGRNRIALY